MGASKIMYEDYVLMLEYEQARSMWLSMTGRIYELPSMDEVTKYDNIERGKMYGMTIKPLDEITETTVQNATVENITYKYVDNSRRLFILKK